MSVKTTGLTTNYTLVFPLVYILLVTVTECAWGSGIQIQAISSQYNPPLPL